MDSTLIFNKLKEHWLNNKCEDQFQNILEDENLSIEEREIKSLDFVRDTFKNFAEKNDYNSLDSSLIEIILNWGILMYLQIKDKLYGNETTI